MEYNKMRELNVNEIQEVNGGGVAEWGVSVGTATAFLGMALAVSNPIGAGIFAGASILSSGAAFFYYRMK
jgi:hypothetical protein